MKRTEKKKSKGKFNSVVLNSTSLDRGYVGEGHGGLYNASTNEERRKRKAMRRERSDQVY